MEVFVNYQPTSSSKQGPRVVVLLRSCCAGTTKDIWEMLRRPCDIENQTLGQRYSTGKMFALHVAYQGTPEYL